VEGALEHRDSAGYSSVIRAGDVQRMSAGTGLTHSEYNHSPEESLRLLQIWIEPDRKGYKPGYEERSYSAGAKRDRLRLVVSGNSEDDALSIHQDIRIYASLQSVNHEMGYQLAPERYAWLQLISGCIRLGNLTLKEGDGAAVSGAAALKIRAEEESEWLLFEMS